MDLDRKTRKLLTMHGVPHPRADFSHLYLSRKEGGRGLINVEDCVKLLELSLVEYLRQKVERLLKAAWRRRNRREVEHPNDYKRRKHEESLKDWSAREIHIHTADKRGGW